MKKTKLFGIFSLVLSAGMLLTGCNNLLTGKTGGKTAYIKIGQVNASRSALPDFSTETIANFNFTLTGTKEGDTEKELGSFTSLADLQAESIAITTGTYNFTLRAEKSGSVLEDTITKQEITTGDNSLTFNLKWDETSLDPTCLGNLEITIDFSTAENANLLKVIRIDLLSYDPETEETTQIVDKDSNPISDYQKEFFPVDFSNNNKAIYTLNGLPSGIYLMQAYCYADVYGEVPLLESPLDDIVVITGSQTSKDTIPVASLADVYTISFENLNNTYLSNKNYTQHSPDITLQTLSKSGWAFGGWYDNPNFNGTPITTIPKGSSGNKVLYAKWSRANGITVNIDQANDIYLTASVDELHKAVQFTARGAAAGSTYTWFIDGWKDADVQSNTYMLVPRISGLRTYVIEVISGQLSASATVSISTESDIYVSATANPNVTADGTEEKPFASIEDASAAITSFDYYVDPVIDFTINISGTLTSAQTIPGNMKNYAKSLTLTGRSALVSGIPQDGITLSGDQSSNNALTIQPASSIEPIDFAVSTKNLSISGAKFGICVGADDGVDDGAANVILDSGTLINGNHNGVYVADYATARVKDGATITNNTSTSGSGPVAGIYIKRKGKLYLEGGTISGNLFSSENKLFDIYCDTDIHSEEPIYISANLPETTPFATIIISGLDDSEIDRYKLINNDGLSDSQFAAQCAKFIVEPASDDIRKAIKVNEEGLLEEDILTTLYVSSTTGSSTGTGTASRPFATLENAENYIFNHPNPEADYIIKLEGTFSDSDDYHTIPENLDEKAHSITYIGISEPDGDGNPQDIITGTVNGDREDNALYVATTVPVIFKNLQIRDGCTGIYTGREADITIGQGCLIINNGNSSGVYIDKGKVTLDGGTITNNAGDNGAGVSVINGEFIMKSGTIYANNSTGSGGGVYVGYDGQKNGTFTMLGGTIRDNEASVEHGHGVSVEPDSTFNIGGSAVIESPNDIYLADGAKITIVDALTGTSPIATITPETYSTDNVILTLGKDSNGNDITTTTIATASEMFTVKADENNTTDMKWYIGPDGHLSRETMIVGDLLLNDNSFVPYSENLSYTAEQVNKAVGIVYALDDENNPRGIIGIKNSGTHKWTTTDTMGYSRIESIICTPSATGANVADTTTFTGQVDGSNNWTIISDLDPIEASYAETNYPAFNYVNNYAATAGLSGTYANGWYMPSVAELCYIYRNITTINSVLNAIINVSSNAANTLVSNAYWTSSQDADTDKEHCALYVSLVNGAIISSNKTSPYRVCCIHNLDDVQKYSVAFNTNGGTAISTKLVKEGQNAIPPTPPKRANFTFDGWYTDSALTQQFDFATAITANITLYAKWSPAAGSILMTDGSYASINEITTENISEIVGLVYDLDEDNNPRGVLGIKNTGSDRYAWAPADTPGFTTLVEEIICTPSDYGANTAATVTFTGDLDGSDNWAYICSKDPEGAANAATNYPAFNYANNYGSCVALNLVDTDYEYGWYMPSIAEQCYVYKNQTVLNSILNELNEITAGTANTMVDFYWSSSPRNAYPYNYAWYVNISDDDTNRGVFMNGKNGTKHIYCIRKIKAVPDYTVVFNSNGGTAVASQKVEKGKKATEPTPPTKEGYVFGGWYDSTLTQRCNLNSLIISSHRVYYAKWNIPGFVYVPGGTFSYTAENALHPTSEVFITGRSITIPTMYASDHEVTQGEYEQYCKYGDIRPVDYNNGACGVGENYPAYFVNWYDAIVYCNLRSKAEHLTEVYKIGDETDPTKWPGIEGNATDGWCGPAEVNTYWDAITFDETANGYRLPTEAEWEFLARNRNNDCYTYSGSDTLKDVAWYKNEGYGTTHVVKGKNPNGLDIYDMSGNVWEICWDWSSETIDIDTPYAGPSSGPSRVLRGGSWYDEDTWSAVDKRYSHGQTPRSNHNIGFRVVRTITE